MNNIHQLSAFSCPSTHINLLEYSIPAALTTRHKNRHMAAYVAAAWYYRSAGVKTTGNNSGKKSKLVKMFKMVKMVKNDPKWSKLVKIVKNGQTRSKIVNTGQKWSKMVKNGLKWRA